MRCEVSWPVKLIVTGNTTIILMASLVHRQGATRRILLETKTVYYRGTRITRIHVILASITVDRKAPH